MSRYQCSNDHELPEAALYCPQCGEAIENREPEAETKSDKRSSLGRKALIAAAFGLLVGAATSLAPVAFDDDSPKTMHIASASTQCLVQAQVPTF
jgi:hypothetical protein